MYVIFKCTSLNHIYNILSCYTNIFFKYRLCLIVNKNKDMYKKFFESFNIKFEFLKNTNKIKNFLILNDNLSDLNLDIIKKYPLLKLLKNNCINNAKDYMINNNINYKKINNKYRYNLNIIGIFDKFTFEQLNNYMNIELLSYNYNTNIEIKTFDFFFCESTWNGNNGDWKYKIRTYDDIDKKLLSFLKYCNKNKIPTIFWNKEDYINYDLFINTAKYFDYIFTTDINCVEKYKKITKKNNIYTLPFFCAPFIHNPINRIKTLNTVSKYFFAGSFYWRKHSSRNDDTKYILNFILNKKKQLLIFDRQYKKDQSTLNIFPNEYNNCIYNPIDYNKLINYVHKENEICINTNSVNNSDTMFSRRIYESLAMKNLIVTTYSKGIMNIFKNYVIFIDKNYKENNLNLLNCNSNINLFVKKEIIKHKGWRLVNTQHSIYNRMNFILDILKLDRLKFNYTPLISIICSTNRINNVNIILNNFNRQKYKNKELIIIFNLDKVDKKITGYLDKTNIKYLIIKSEITLGECLNIGIEESSGEIISKFDDDDFYGNNYLSDNLLSMIMSNAELLGKGQRFVYVQDTHNLYIRNKCFKTEKYVDKKNWVIAGGTLFFKKYVFDKYNVKFTKKNKGEDSQFIKDLLEKNCIIYSTNIFNYCYIKKLQNNNHTWNIDINTFLKKSIYLGKYKNIPLNIINI